MLTYCKT